MTQTLAARVAWAAVLSACVSATVAAAASSVAVNALLVRSVDRRLVEAATQLARELDTVPAPRLDDRDAIALRIEDEQSEATSNGIAFSVYAGGGILVGGDGAAPAIARGCENIGELRVCRVDAGATFSIMAASAHRSENLLFAFATLTAALVASLSAWAIGRRFARRAVGPLLRLQMRVAALGLERAHLDDAPPSDLGPDEGVRELDELRKAMSTALLRMHDALNRATRFAADAAHELRTPLTVLRAELELLAESDASDGARQALRKVVQLNALTERLLVLALPEASVESRAALLSVRDLVDEAIANLPADQASRVSYAGEDDMLVHGDESELGIVVSNGISNALKFGTHAVIELTTTGDRRVLAIDDDGPGVSAAQRELVFAPFARGAGTQAVPGHGLGLALVAHVTRRHGGEARLIESTLHPTGARLEIRLPVPGPSADSSRRKGLV